MISAFFREGWGLALALALRAREESYIALYFFSPCRSWFLRNSVLALAATDLKR